MRRLYYRDWNVLLATAPRRSPDSFCLTDRRLRRTSGYESCFHRSPRWTLRGLALGTEPFGGLRIQHLPWHTVGGPVHQAQFILDFCGSLYGQISPRWVHLLLCYYRSKLLRRRERPFQSNSGSDSIPLMCGDRSARAQEAPPLATVFFKLLGDCASRCTTMSAPRLSIRFSCPPHRCVQSMRCQPRKLGIALPQSVP